MLAEILNLLREQRVLPNVVNSATNRPCASGDPVSTWVVDGTARTIVPPVGFPTRESEHLPGSPCQWTYAAGPLRAKNQRHSSRPKPETRPVVRNRKETRRLTPFAPSHRTTGKSWSQTETRNVTQLGWCRLVHRETLGRALDGTENLDALNPEFASAGSTTWALFRDMQPGDH